MKPKNKRGAPLKSDGRNRRDKTPQKVETEKPKTIPPQPSASLDSACSLPALNGKNQNAAVSTEPSDSPVKTRWHQTTLQLITWALIGIFALGSGLDAISNAVALITPAVTYVGTGLVFCAALASGFYLKYFSLSWVVEGKRIKKTELESKQYVQIFGMIFLLWIPRIFDFFKSPEPHRNNAAKVSTEQIEQPQTKPTTTDRTGDINAPTATNQTQPINVQPTAEAAKTPQVVEQPELSKSEGRVKLTTRTPKNDWASTNDSKAVAPDSLAVAENLFRRGKYDEAIAACDAALRRNPKNQKAAALKQRIKKTKQILEQ